MSKIQIWHNARCSKSREGLCLLEDGQFDFEIFNYMNEPFQPGRLVEVIKMSEHPLSDFIRKNEPEYRELGLNEKELTIEEFAEIAARHPRLLQRPIIIKDGKAIIARPAERINEII